jgi:hypothetical protein
MSNPRSASNAWAKIRTKLITPDGSAPAPTPKKAGGRKKAIENDGDEAGKVTPKKAGGRKKAAQAEDDEAVEATPTKTPRKRLANKQDVDGEASPKKKPRAKKVPESECTCMVISCPK